MVFEYRRPFPYQTDLFAAEIIWHNEEDVKMLLKGLIVRYEKFKFKPNPEWTHEELQQRRDEARNAVQTLKDVFCDRKGFATTEDVKQYLFQSQAHTREYVVSQLVQWAMEKICNYADSSSQTKFKAPSAVHMRQQLSQFTKAQKRRPSLWHLIKLVKYDENIIFWYNSF